MAKSLKDARKITFGKRREGSAKKRKGPKDKQTSKYVGQGR
jgi:hypothetical protein